MTAYIEVGADGYYIYCFGFPANGNGETVEDAVNSFYYCCSMIVIDYPGINEPTSFEFILNTNK